MKIQQKIVGVERGFNAGVDELDQYLDNVLQALGLGRFGSGVLDYKTKQPDEQNAQQYRPQHTVHVDGPESHLFRFFRRMREPQMAFVIAAKGEKTQVVRDVFVS